ncbi:MAG: hypothetical protein LBL70_01855 [Treponema sp.]|jgi:hypothetical protein|nr:hypothetical protein [Treponema sp.]
MASFESVELTKAVMPDSYALDKRGYEYLFFKIPEDIYDTLSEVRVTMDVISGITLLVINGYLDNTPIFAQGMGTTVTFPSDNCEAGENTLAYKGHINITNIEFIVRAKGAQPVFEKAGDPLLQAVEFLFNSRIRGPQKSPFQGACYCIYDYNDQTHRMSNWVWNNAVVVGALLALAKSGLYPEREEEFKNFARGVGEEFLATRITGNADPVYGALVSRYKNLGAPSHPADCLVGPNDTSFSVKWALLPLYELTGEKRYYDAACLALQWVRNSIYLGDFVPLDYNTNTGRWGDYTIIDTAFLPEGLEAFDRLGGSSVYTQDIRYFMNRFIDQFALDTGYYGQNYTPKGGVTRTIFSRGEGWAIEGLLAAYRAAGDPVYLKEASRLGTLMADQQNKDGSWSYVLGYDGRPDSADKAGTGICEKGTAVLAYFLLELYQVNQDQRFLDAAGRALAWCEENMSREAGPGYGGINARSLNSGITGLPYLTTATGYANAFYILAKIKRMELEKQFPVSGL